MTYLLEHRPLNKEWTQVAVHFTRTNAKAHYFSALISGHYRDLRLKTECGEIILPTP